MQRLQKKYCRRSFEFNTTVAVTAKTTINRLKKNLELTEKKEEIESEDKDVKEEKKDQKKQNLKMLKILVLMMVIIDV